MNPILILREETVCLIILLFLLFTSRIYRMGKDSRVFNMLLAYATLHVAFDFITVLTVNRFIDISPLMNDICHGVFYVTGLLYAHEIWSYVYRLCYPDTSRKQRVSGYICIGVFVLLLPVLKIDYVEAVGTFSSSGPAAYVGYGLAFLCFILSIILIAINRKKLSQPVKIALFPMLLVLIIAESIQVVRKELLFTGGAVTIVTLGFFFSLENPVFIFERKAMTDALTGVGSRNSYDSDIFRMEQEFRKNRDRKYTFVFFDINNLRAVNRNFGHPEGDNYITFIASALLSELASMEHVYRIGGDEFLAVYRDVTEETVCAEITRVKERCSEAANRMKYIPSVSAGYAVSNPECKSLKDVVRTADYMMFQDKSNRRPMGKEKAQGTELNLTGLTDRLFSAVCLSNDRTYPYVTNMDTNVTRIAPGWMEFFGLPSEFYGDFNSVWLEKIHPDDREKFMQDVTDVLSGKKRYHMCEYRARSRDGVYVTCSCTGAIYHSRDDESDIFAGYLVNHGAVETIDAVTGLKNFHTLDDRVGDILANSLNAIMIKLAIVHFDRINMLYSYLEGDDVLREIARILKDVVGSNGEVFCQDGINFTVLMMNASREKAVAIYNTVRSMFAKGVTVRGRNVPLELCGGACEIRPDLHLERKTIRSRLLYALDESVYARHGKLVFFDIGQNEKNIEIVDLLKAIHRDAIGEKKGFTMRFQPIVDTKTCRVCGAEALMRWIHPTMGEIPPGSFIGFLEDDPCYYNLAMYLMVPIVTFAKEMRSVIPDFRINVNVTAVQLQHEGFADQLLELLREMDYPPQGMVIELTERCKELDTGMLAAACAHIRENGFRMAFDDMGTGYSTFSLLMTISVDEIKLDHDFVMSLKDNRAYRLFVEALQRGRADRRYEICFEGVENEQMLEDVRSFGDSLSQGYYFSRPLPSEDFMRMYGRR